MDAKEYIKEGTRIDTYVTGPFLGEGSYGETYRAKGDDGNTCAIKLLKTNAEAGGEDRFENEAWALGKLDHPNLPRLIGRGEFNQIPYLVMSFARGKTLGKIILSQLEDGGAMGENRVLDILIDVLQGLSYLHSLEITHRDIKPDNIIVKDSTASSCVIDLGFCKGIAQPIAAGTFFNAGASRYCPPSKLDHPGRANPKDDVFAVGVIAYQLLTNAFPWSVSTDEDVGDLKMLMLSKTPPAVSAINNMASSNVDEWVFSLLQIDESKRPSASEATQSALSIRHATTTPSAKSSTTYLLATRVIRDPVHGDIRLTEFEWSIVASKEFQRLRYIKQLGLANLVYPSAEHTRFAHALGALHVTEKILRSVELSTGRVIAIEDRLLARSYALIHDINHVPFGHTIEDELSIFSRHDENNERTTRMFFVDQSEVGARLRTTEYGKIILEHLESDAKTVQRKLHLKEFIDSPFGADALDYIDRDAYFCGLDHRIDSSVYRRFSLLEGSRDGDEHFGMRLYGSHGIRLDASSAIHRILFERYSLFLKVYAHTMKFSAGAMLGKALYYSIGAGRTQLKQKIWSG